MLQNVGSMIFVIYHFVKSRINRSLNMEAFGCRQLQKTQYFAETPQGRALNASWSKIIAAVLFHKPPFFKIRGLCDASSMLFDPSL